MNYSTAIFLINDKARAVLGQYEAGEHAPKTMFKTLDQSLKVGELALVATDTRHNMTVVKITDVDVDFDIETGMQINWVIGKVDTSAYDALVAQEQAAIKVIQSAEKNRKRQKLREAVLADAEGQLSGMPIAAIAHEKPEVPQAG